MEKLKKWANGKPVGLVIIAQQLAVGAEACFEILRLIKAGEKIEALSAVQKDKEWVSHNRNRRRTKRSFIECLRRFGRKTGNYAGAIGGPNGIRTHVTVVRVN